MNTQQPLSPAAVATLLRASLEAIKQEMNALDASQTTWRPQPDEWSANEILRHLIEVEQYGFAGRIMHILQADHPTFPNWPQSSAEHEQAQKQRDTADLLREFEALRTASLELIESLQPEELSRSGHHQMAGDMTIQDLLHEWVFHDRDHTQQLYANVKAIAWPHMGNTQHFSTPPAT